MVDTGTQEEEEEHKKEELDSTMEDPGNKLRYHEHNGWPNGCAFREKKEQRFGQPLCQW